MELFSTCTTNRRNARPITNTFIPHTLCTPASKTTTLYTARAHEDIKARITRNAVLLLSLLSLLSFFGGYLILIAQTKQILSSVLIIPSCP